MTDQQLDQAIAGQKRAIRGWKGILAAALVIIACAALAVGGVVLLQRGQPAAQQAAASATVGSGAASTAMPTAEPTSDLQDALDKPLTLDLNTVTERALANLGEADGTAAFDTVGLELDVQSRTAIDTAVQAITDQGFEVSYVAVDLATGGVASANGGVERYSASSIKAPYIVSLAQTGTIDLDAVADGTDATVTNLVVPTLHVSDNDAYDALYRRYGRQPFLEWAQGTGIADTQIGYYGDLTALDLARMWTMMADYLFADEPLYGADASAGARGWLAEQMVGSLNSVIAEAEPDMLVYSKGGWIYGEGGFYALNDGGLVIADEDSADLDAHPHGTVIAVLSNACGRNDLLVPLVQALEGAVQSGSAH